jgi:hypothetical protein
MKVKIKQNGRENSSLWNSCRNHELIRNPIVKNNPSVGRAEK